MMSPFGTLRTYVPTGASSSSFPSSARISTISAVKLFVMLAILNLSSSLMGVAVSILPLPFANAMGPESPAETIATAPGILLYSRTLSSVEDTIVSVILVCRDG